MVLVAAAVIIAVPAVNANAEHKHCLCGDGKADGMGNHDCADVTWTAWGDDEAEKNVLPNVAGNYYLVADMDLTETWKPTVDVNLCLNGKTIHGKVAGMMEFHTNNTTIGICDCSKEASGKIISETKNEQSHMSDGTGKFYFGQVITVFKQVNLNLYSGTITMDAATRSNGGLIVFTGKTGAGNNYGGTTNLYNAVITGGYADDNYGGNIHIGWYGSTDEATTHKFNMYGGEISNGYAKFGGNIAIRNAGQMNFYGGKIINGYAPNGGGNMYADAGTKAFTQFNITGDFVMANGRVDVSAGGNLMVTRFTVTMSGGAIINGMTRMQMSTAGANVALGSNSYAAGFNMSGGIITGGKCLDAAGLSAAIWVNANKAASININFSGTAQVYGNVAVNQDAPCDLMSIGNYTVSNLQPGAKLCFTNPAEGLKITGTAADAKYLFVNGSDKVLAYDATVGKIVVKDAVTGFTSLQAALDAEEANITLNGNNEKLVTLKSDVIIANGDYAVNLDLAGFNATCTGAGLVTAVDSEATYTEGATVIAQNVANTAKNGKLRYAAVNTGAGYEIHRFYVGITDSWLNAAAEGMSFQVTAQGDIEEYGVYISIEGVEGEFKFTLTDGDSVVMIKNFFENELQDADVTVKAYVVIDDEEVQSAKYTFNFGEMITAAAELDNLDATKQALIDALYAKYAPVTEA